MEELNIFKFKDVKMVPDPFINNKYPSSSSTSSKSTTIVVDNGKSKNTLIALFKNCISFIPVHKNTLT